MGLNTETQSGVGCRALLHYYRKFLNKELHGRITKCFKSCGFNIMKFENYINIVKLYTVGDFCNWVYIGFGKMAQ